MRKLCQPCFALANEDANWKFNCVLLRAVDADQCTQCHPQEKTVTMAGQAFDIDRVMKSR